MIKLLFPSGKHRSLSFSFFLLFLTIGCLNSNAQNFSEIIKAVASDAAYGDEFGYSVSISGDYAIVGAPFNSRGSAYILKKDQGGTDNWGQVKKITGSDTGFVNKFGTSVFISGDYAIVGELVDGNGPNGAAYIFKKDQGGTDNWGQVQKVNGFGGYDSFGYSVSMSGDYAIVGAPLEDETTSSGFDTGAAYIFKKDQGGTDNWGQVQKITASSPGFQNQFGYSVSISGDHAIVGEPFEGNDFGSAYIFKKDQGGTDNWGQVDQLTAFDAAEDDLFGYSVSISGDHAIVGAPFEGDDSTPYSFGVNTNSGSAYRFKKDQGGNWGLAQKMSALDLGDDDNFGTSVSISGNHAIVGVPFEGNDFGSANPGSAYIFKESQGGYWEQVQKIVPSNSGSDIKFGASVSISGDYAMAGAPLDGYGSAYIFKKLSFITTWQTTSINESITIPTTGSGYNYDVDWGDGQSSINQTGNATHTYASPGIHTVSISGSFPRIYFNNTGDKNKIMTIEQWGNNEWTSMGHAFFGTSNLTYNATDVPNLSVVTTMYYMFSYASSFNGDLGDWDVSSVTNMYSMFSYASSFNGDLGDWDVSSVTNMYYMFYNASSFNANLGDWDVSSVTDMESMFYNASSFNANLGDWDVSSVTDMESMFSYASSFNANLGDWDVSSVTNMRYMFSNASSFNGDLSDWDVSSVMDMMDMFYYAGSFNGDLSDWDVSSVTDMESMFFYASSFNANLGDWDVSSVISMSSMLDNTALSVTNYDNTLIGWEAQGISNKFLGAYGLDFCLGETARTSLIDNYGWYIYGDNMDCPDPIITAQPMSMFKCPGQSITFSVSATGNNLIYQWKRNGTDISNATNSDLTINNLNSTHAGDYTCEVSDIYGSVTSNTATLTLDIVKPIITNCPSNITQATDAGQCGATISWTAPGAMDNCDANPTVNQTVGSDNGSFFSVGTKTIKYTATDASGNESLECSFTVTITDNTNPAAKCQNQTIVLNVNGNASTTAANIDNGSSDACGIITLGLSKTFFNCNHVGANTVTLTVTDDNSNTATCTATVTVQDNTNPVAKCQNQTIVLNVNGNASTTAANINNLSSDACGISLALSQTAFTCDHVGGNTVTLTVTDDNTNSSTCTATVTVQDNTAPNPVCQNETIVLDVNGNASTTAANINNGSSDACGITLGLSQTAFTCDHVGANTVTLTVTDDNTNSSTCTATVTVQDNTAPNPVCQNQTIVLINYYGASVSITAANIDNGSSDACGITLGLSKTFFNCNHVGANTVTLTVTDDNSNTATCTATVTVQDNTAPNPVCQNETIVLDVNGNASTTAANINNGSSDACGISLALSQTAFTCDHVGANTVTLTVTDENTNTATCTATVTVEDNTAPNPVCQNETIVLDVNGNASTTAANIDNGSWDACGISLALSQTAFTCDHVGANTVTLTVTDDNTNTATCTATVTVQDNTAPNPVCQNETIVLDVNGNASTTAANIDNGSWDACGINLALSQTAFNCDHVGANTVTLTVTDDNTNNSTCTATVTVQDNTAPNPVCQNETIVLDVNGNASTTAANIDNGSWDACGISLALSQTAFTCDHVGANTVTLTVTDDNSNSSTCTATVTVQDNTAPNPVCQNQTIVLDVNGNASTTAANIDNGSWDACGISLALSQTAFTCEHVGANTVTLTVTDDNSNTATCTATVTVQDNTAPNPVCQNQTIVLDVNGNASTTAANIDNGSWDACGISLALSQTAFTCDHVGANTVTLTVTDDNTNTATCTATVTVEDNTAPNPVCQNETIVLDVNGNASTTAANIDNGSWDACGISLALSQTAFTCDHVGANTVTLTVTDDNSNTAICTATVTVQDNTAPNPVCQNQTIVLDVNGNASTTAANIDNGSWDACGISLALSQTAFTCDHVGANTVTLTVTDDNTNTATCTATVTVEDNTAPNPVCQNQTIQLDTNGEASTTAVNIDNGSWDACGISLALSQTAFNCVHVGANTVTLTVTDDNSNTATCTATVTVEALTTMTINDVTKSEGSPSGFNGYIFKVTRSDAGCAIDFDYETQDGTATLADNDFVFKSSAQSFPKGGSLSRTISVNAVKDDKVEIDEMFTVLLSNVSNTVASFVSEGTATLLNDDGASLSISDESDDEAAGVLSFDVTLSGSVAGGFSVDYDTQDGSAQNESGDGDYTANNGTLNFAGNSGETHTIYIAINDDNTVELTENFFVNISNVQGAPIVIAGAQGEGLLINNDAASISISDVSMTEGDAGTKDFVFTATQTGTVETAFTLDFATQDNTAEDETGDGDYTSNAGTINFSGTDGETQNITVTVNGDCQVEGYEDFFVNLSNIQAGGRNITFTDDQGTGSIMDDDNLPNINTCPSDFTASADMSCGYKLLDYTGMASASGGCGNITLSQSPTSGTTIGLGINTITITATDGAGNQVSCDFEITVEDNAAPTALCQNISISLSSSGQQSISTAQINAGSSDNCNLASLSLDETSFDCTNIGANTVTLTVTDATGLTDACTATVTVIGVQVTCYLDSDGDEYGNANQSQAFCFSCGTGYVMDNTDCDDTNATLNPGITEICDGIDNNCDGNIDEGFDADGDGYSTCNGDCDDTNAALNPGITEICDGIDNNCDGNIDEGFDMDGDGFSTCNGDCNDNDITINPNVAELCDGIDNNCDGQIDEGFDFDNDGFSVCNGDCDDTNAAIHPGAIEICDGLDNDCNGLIDDGTSGTFTGDVILLSQAQVDAFSTCTSIIDGNLIITGANITNLTGLNNLVEVTQDVSISNTSLSELGGLGNLASIGGSLNVTANALLQDIAGLSSLTTLGSSLNIIQNISLFDLIGLEGLTNVSGDLGIIQNVGLVSLEGLDNITTVNGNLTILVNPILTDCCPIYNLLNGGVTGMSLIFGNNTGCETLPAIFTACSPVLPLLLPSNTNCQTCPAEMASEISHEAYQTIEVYPNPAQGFFHLQIKAPFEQGTVELRDISGKVILKKVLNTHDTNYQIAVQDLRSGMYVLIARLDGKLKTEKVFIR